MRNVRPMEPFLHLYPFAPEEVMDIAYYFEFDYSDGRAADAYAAEALALARRWIADESRGAVTLTEQPDGTLCVLDSRSNIEGGPRRARLRGWKAAVFGACDRAQPLRVLAGLPEVVAAGVSLEQLGAFLDRCVAHRLMVRSERSWLNVAVHTPPRDLAPPRYAQPEASRRRSAPPELATMS